MTEVVSDEIRNMVIDIKNNYPEAWEKLKAKCRWEQMIPARVIREYGDPREW